MLEKILYLEKRGADFFNDDERVKNSNVGNYRVTTPDYSIYDNVTGRMYAVELIRADKRNYRSVNIRTGKKLKKPVITVENENELHMSASFHDENGGRSDLSKNGFYGDYTLENILKTINTVFNQDYTKIEFLD